MRMHKQHSSRRQVMTAVLEAEGITKRYGHVTALNEAAFEARAGEVTALIGDNGAGKSTLVKVLSGVIAPDDGTIRLGGEITPLDSPQHAKDLGIETVFQDLALAPELGPAENVFVGRELLRAGWLGRLGRPRQIRDASPRTRGVRRDGDGCQGHVRAGRGALRRAASERGHLPLGDVRQQAFMFLDEPTAALGVRQTPQRARSHQPGGRPGGRRDPDQPQHAGGAGGLGPDRSAPPGAPGRAVLGSNVTVEDLVGAMTGALELRGEGPK